MWACCNVWQAASALAKIGDVESVSLNKMADLLEDAHTQRSVLLGMLILLTREIWCCQSVKALCRARPNLLVQSSARVPSNSHMHSEGQLSSSEICCCSRFGWVPALDADLAVGTHSDLFTELQSVWDDMSLLKFKAWSLRASQSIHPMRLGDDGAEYSHKAAAFKSRHGRNVHPSSAQWKNMVYILYIYIY